MAQITFGDHTIDTASLPVQSVEALLRRGLSHFLGNEQASKVAGWVKAFEKANPGQTVDEADKEAKKSEYVKAALQALTDGTVGMGRAPAISPLEREIDRLARAEVVAVLKSNGIKPPKGDEKVKFANGAEFTMDELIERRIEKFRDVLTAAAQKKIAADEKRRKAAEADAAKLRADGEATVENLGL